MPDPAGSQQADEPREPHRPPGQDPDGHVHPFQRTELYRRLHAHPALAVVTKVVVTVVGGAVLGGGIIMLVTPGPAFVLIPLGLAILAMEWAWARRLLVHARQAAERARQRTMAMDPATRRRRLLLAVLALACVVAAGVLLALWFHATVMS